MTASSQQPELCPLGVDGVLVRFARTLSEEANQRATRFGDLVCAANLPGVAEVASSLTSVRVAFDPAITNRTKITDMLQPLLDQDLRESEGPKRRWHIPVAFGPDYAPQLAEAAALAGLTPEQAVAEIEAQPLRVIAIGFAPGQPYLGMLPAHWDIPRQTELTPQMPAGALIVAVRQLIIFAAEAPTGWRHIGQTAFRVYRPEQPEPFAFQPGDAVQFRAVDDDTFRQISADIATNGGARCEVLR